MGECGCGQENVAFRFDGPEGVTYGLEVYPGCHYCGNGPAVTLYRIEHDEYDLLHEADELIWADSVTGVKVANVAIVTPEALVESMKEYMADHLVSPEYLNPSGLFRTLEDAVGRTER